jgi:outer membrane protein OmpA-like peptidoglycan-associated protein
VRESQGPAEALAALEEVLRASVIQFEPGQSAISAAEQPKIEAMANAIGAAGPAVRVVVGGQLDLTGDPKDNAAMARKRAEGVIAGLVGKGVPAEALEAAVFETSPADADRERQVELLIK